MYQKVNITCTRKHVFFPYSTPLTGFCHINFVKKKLIINLLKLISMYMPHLSFGGNLQKKMFSHSVNETYTYTCIFISVAVGGVSSQSCGSCGSRSRDSAVLGLAHREGRVLPVLRRRPQGRGRRGLPGRAGRAGGGGHQGGTQTPHGRGGWTRGRGCWAGAAWCLGAGAAPSCGGAGALPGVWVGELSGGCPRHEPQGQQPLAGVPSPVTGVMEQ